MLQFVTVGRAVKRFNIVTLVRLYVVTSNNHASCSQPQKEIPRQRYGAFISQRLSCSRFAWLFMLLPIDWDGAAGICTQRFWRQSPARSWKNCTNAALKLRSSVSRSIHSAAWSRAKCGFSITKTARKYRGHQRNFTRHQLRRASPSPAIPQRDRCAECSAYFPNSIQQSQGA